MLKLVYDYNGPEMVYCFTGCSAGSGGHSGTSYDPNKEQDPGPCEGLSKNNGNQNKDEDYCGYFH